MSNHYSHFRDGIKACLPTILGYWSIGFSAGVIGATYNFGVFEVFLLAALLYAGSSQFIFYSLAATLIAPINVIIAVLFVNMRYLLMSSSLAPCFKGQSVLKNFIVGAQLTDETFGVATNYGKVHGSIPFCWMLGLNVLAYLNWVFANVAGVLVVSQIPVSAIQPLQFSLVAMFIGLVIQSLKSSKHKYLDALAIVTSAIITILMGLLVSSDYGIILSTIITSTLILMVKKWKFEKAYIPL